MQFFNNFTYDFLKSITENYKLHELETYGKVRNAVVWQIMPSCVNKRILGFNFLSNIDFNDSFNHVFLLYFEKESWEQEPSQHMLE